MNDTVKRGWVAVGFWAAVALSSAGCAEDPWSGVPQGGAAEHKRDGVSRGTLTSEEEAESLAAEPEEEARDAEACVPYTDAVLEMAGHADDFEGAGPDIEMTWVVEADGVYIAELTHTGASAAEVFVLRGACAGSSVPPVRGLENGWPGYSFAAVKGELLTLVIEGAEDTETVQLSLTLGCELADESHCVRADADGEPECGVRYADEHSPDRMSCEPMHAPGEEDGRCPDTDFRGDVVAGCCMPSGECGHLDAELGCHMIAQEEWASSPAQVFYCDDRAVPAPPAYFECSYDACQTALDCCLDANGENATCVDEVCVPAG